MKEIDRRGFINTLNHHISMDLGFWKMEADSKISMDWLNQDLSQVDKNRLSLTIKIYAGRLATSEGSRAVLPTDLKKWFKREGEFFVTEFHPKKDPKANAIVKAVNLGGNPVLVIMNNEYGVYSLQASFFPREIASIRIK